MKNQIKRVLFDLDGTLWDTQKFHAGVEVDLMKEYGVVVSADEITAKYAGRVSEHVFMEVLGCDLSVAQDLTKRKWEKILPMAKDAVELCSLREFFSAIKDRNVDISIGTASPVKWARDLLEMHDLSDFIDKDRVIGGDMVQNGKPAPDIWIKAAGDTPLENCLVVEDGLAGIEGAVKVGINCALILPRLHPQAISINNASDILDILNN